ncbi:MAG: hypothetical protein IT276_15630 [Ignavibacteriaceae bacterium]|nr:hypothetical protein [Ignavibacteriaceae bacterium]HMN26097.1 hypothetical protein [Ignavibacteriaceae bacterium]
MLSEIISFQTNGIVSLVEFTTKRVNTIDYISGAIAIEKNYIELKEISQSGNVNNIVVQNKSDKYVFFSDGDILSGAKQNRVLNTSVFLSPNSTKQIPVSCVEQGRWSSVTPKFAGTNYTAPMNLRAKKSEQVTNNLKREVGHFSNQSEIWNEVDSCCERLVISSPTQNLSDVFKEKEKEFETFIKTIRVTDKANGMAVFIKKEFLAIEVFNRTDIYKEYFDKILKGVSSEASHLNPVEEKLKEAEATYKTNVFFDELENRKFKQFPGAGIGTEKRYEENDFSGFALEYESHLIHLAMLSLINKN